jgi:hypothetical protein
MRRYGTQLVAGVSAGHGGEKIADLPVFDLIEEAIAGVGAVDMSVILNPPYRVLDASLEAIAAGIKDGTIDPPIVVGIWNTPDRRREYCPWDLGPEYAKFIIEELMPEVNRHFRTRVGSGSTGTMGSSMGGLISFWLCWKHPDRFGLGACVSTHFPFSAVNLAKAQGKDPAPGTPETPLILAVNARNEPIARKLLAWSSSGLRVTPCGVEKVDYVVQVGSASTSYPTLTTPSNWMRLPATAAHAAIVVFNTDASRSLDFKVLGALTLYASSSVPRTTEVLAEQTLSFGTDSGIIQLPDALRFFWVPTKMTAAGAAVSAELHVVVW